MRSVWLFSACLQLSLGVAAMFGPHSGVMSRHVGCIGSRMEIPHVITAVEWTPWRGGQWRDDRLFTVNVYPSGRQLGRLYVDLIRLFHWNDFSVVFTNSRGSYQAILIWSKYVYFIPFDDPTVAIWVHPLNILCQTGLSRHL